MLDCRWLQSRFDFWWRRWRLDLQQKAEQDHLTVGAFWILHGKFDSLSHSLISLCGVVHVETACAEVLPEFFNFTKFD